ncbi:MAG TPA: hypothetical protein VF323_07965, partial [Candidatus Limnocylindrales bacterium]
MRVNRRFLYWGVFLIAIGGVLVATDVRAVDTSTIADALRLWPLAVVAIGLGLVLRRTRFSLPAGMLAMAVPGLLLGGGFALAPRIAVDCGIGGTLTGTAIQQGTFDGPARISVTSGCGSLIVDTAAGSGWRLDAGNTRGRTPSVDASARNLSIDAGGHTDWHWFDSGRDAWHLTLPTSALDVVSVVVNAGESDIGLPGAQIGRLELTSNAARTRVDLSEASVASLSGTVNAGLLSFHLPANADVAGSIEINAGSLQVCAP